MRRRSLYETKYWIGTTGGKITITKLINIDIPVMGGQQDISVEYLYTNDLGQKITSGAEVVFKNIVKADSKKNIISGRTLVGITQLQISFNGTTLMQDISVYQSANELKNFDLTLSLPGGLTSAVLSGIGGSINLILKQHNIYTSKYEEDVYITDPNGLTLISNDWVYLSNDNNGLLLNAYTNNGDYRTTQINISKDNILSNSIIINQTEGYGEPKLVSAEFELIPINGGILKLKELTFTQTEGDKVITYTLDNLQGATITYPNTTTFPARAIPDNLQSEADKILLGTYNVTITRHNKTKTYQINAYQQGNQIITIHYKKVWPGWKSDYIQIGTLGFGGYIFYALSAQWTSGEFKSVYHVDSISIPQSTDWLKAEVVGNDQDTASILVQRNTSGVNRSTRITLNLRGGLTTDITIKQYGQIPTFKEATKPGIDTAYRKGMLLQYYNEDPIGPSHMIQTNNVDTVNTNIDFNNDDQGLSLYLEKNGTYTCIADRYQTSGLGANINQPAGKPGYTDRWLMHTFYHPLPTPLSDYNVYAVVWKDIEKEYRDVKYGPIQVVSFT